MLNVYLIVVIYNKMEENNTSMCVQDITDIQFAENQNIEDR